MNTNIKFTNETYDYVGELFSEILFNNKLPKTFDPTKLLSYFAIANSTIRNLNGENSSIWILL